jgi:hypothetical protein
MDHIKRAISVALGVTVGIIAAFTSAWHLVCRRHCRHNRCFYKRLAPCLGTLSAPCLGTLSGTLSALHLICFYKRLAPYLGLLQVPVRRLFQRFSSENYVQISLSPAGGPATRLMWFGPSPLCLTPRLA